MNCLCGTVRYIPLLLVIFVPLTFLITYAIAVCRGHVFPVWPYISDTGTLPPESCIFSLFLNAAAYSLFIVVYIRYLEVAECIRRQNDVKKIRIMNQVGVLLGCLSCLGLIVVANFQETNAFEVHIIGALVCFLAGTLYFVLQTIFTFKRKPRPFKMFCLRVVLTVLNVVFMIGVIVPIGPAIAGFKVKHQSPLFDNPGWDVLLQWSPSDGGYLFHIISTISEWLLIFCFCAYVGTIFWDFNRLQIEPLRIKVPVVEESSRTQEPPPEVSPAAPEKKTWF